MPTILVCSPRERGWSHRHSGLQDLEQVLPARAGMVPCRFADCAHRGCAPRASEDGPSGVLKILSILACSPRERGWSPRARR